MLKSTALAAVCVALIGVFTPLSNALPQNAPPQTDTEIQALLKASAFLEEKPFDAKARDVRAAAMKWVIDTDKVSVTVCGDLFSGIDQRYRYRSEILAQYTIGMAAFKLSNPTKAKDENAAQLAGLESALTSYQIMVKEQANAKQAFIDDLLAKKSNGELAAFVKKNNCVKLETA